VAEHGSERARRSGKMWKGLGSEMHRRLVA